MYPTNGTAAGNGLPPRGGANGAGSHHRLGGARTRSGFTAAVTDSPGGGFDALDAEIRGEGAEVAIAHIMNDGFGKHGRQTC